MIYSHCLLYYLLHTHTLSLNLKSVCNIFFFIVTKHHLLCIMKNKNYYITYRKMKTLLRPTKTNVGFFSEKINKKMSKVRISLTNVYEQRTTFVLEDEQSYLSLSIENGLAQYSKMGFSQLKFRPRGPGKSWENCICSLHHLVGIIKFKKPNNINLYCFIIW